MSELGTVEKKSLIARFDNESILRIATSPDDPERLFVSFLDDGKEVTKSLSVNGGYDYPKLHIIVENRTASTVTFPNIYTQATYGMSNLPIVVAANDTDEILAVGQVAENSNPKYNLKYLVNMANDGVNGVIPDSTQINCRYIGGNKVIILDPSLDSYLTLIVRGL